MTLKTYLAMMILATAICWSAFAVVITSVNPNETNRIGFALFFVSLFLSLVGTSAIVGFFIRFIALRQELVFRHVAISFRQSFSFASLAVVLLILQAIDLLTWYNMVFLVLGLTMLEFFLISYKRV
ncbi:MAG: hypothetical protein Q8Q23_02910 [bacterium]|nr:hypothetical protein [bacterium]